MIALPEEIKFRRLRKLGIELLVPVVEAFWEFEARDGQGRVIQKQRQRSHSWVRNAYNMLFCDMAGRNASDSTYGAGYLNYKDTGAAVRYGNWTIPWYYEDNVESPGSLGFHAGAGDASYGIIVGSGINAESFEDYALQTPIAHGTGAGQLSYAASNSPVRTWTPSTKTMKSELVRYFNNNSGGDINVNQVALVAKLQSIYKGLMSRDKLVSTVTIPNTGQLKVTYTIELVYPA